MIVTEGSGFYKEKGKDARPIKKGDVVNILENVEHWHRAAAETKMVHIAITILKAMCTIFIWLKPVSEEGYNAVNK